MAQPPQMPKCGQIGAMRCGLAVLDAKKLAAVGVAGQVLHFDGLARQGGGNKDRPIGAVGHAIAAMADPVDDEMLNHVLASMKNSRLPSPPRIADGTTPPTRQPSEAMKAPMSSQTIL